MNEDAQTALLKTLEEPPSATTIILCADAEEPLLPTIRSRCARLHLGPVGVRDIEAFLEEQGVAEPPVAARLARIAGGRPGLALAWARSPDALRERDSIARSLIDLAEARPADRLSGVRSLAAQATVLASVLSVAAPATPSVAETPPGSPSKRGRARPTAGTPPATAEADGDEAGDDVGPVRAPATERRRAAEALIALWTDVARDLALCQRGLERSIRDIGVLDDTRGLAARLGVAEVGAFLERLGRASVLIATNVAPELVIDDLALAWPRPERLAA